MRHAQFFSVVGYTRTANGFNFPRECHLLYRTRTASKKKQKMMLQSALRKTCVCQASIDVASWAGVVWRVTKKWTVNTHNKWLLRAARDILSLIWFLCSPTEPFCVLAHKNSYTKPKCNQSNSQSILKMRHTVDAQRTKWLHKQWENGFVLVHHYWIKSRTRLCECAPNAHSGFSSALHRKHSFRSHRLTRVFAHSPHPFAPCFFFFSFRTISASMATHTHIYASIEHNQQPNRHHRRCNLLVKCNAVVTGLNIWTLIEQHRKRLPMLWSGIVRSNGRRRVCRTSKNA